MMKLQRSISIFGIFLWIQRITVQMSPVQYVLVNRSLAWIEARGFCRVKHSDLATVNNMDDEKRLIHTLGSHVPYTWIGLHKGGTGRWMWSDGSGRVNFNKWDVDEPNNSNGDEWCVEMSEEGLWNDLSCGEAKGYVCFERRDDGSERYVYYLDGRSWTDSQDLCRQSHTDLAYVRTELDTSDVVGLIKTDAEVQNKAWIGLFNDAWMWSDGRETSFRYWLRGFGYEGNCAAAAGAQQGRWVQANCDMKTTFVCQGGLKVKKILIRMNIHSNLDVTDSTVSHRLLEMLRTELLLRGVTDFRLRRHRVVRH